MAGFKSFLKGLLRTVLYVSFGFFVFILTSLLLYRKGYAKSGARYARITERDSFRLEYPQDMLDFANGGVLLYVDTQPCAKCSQSVILSTLDSFNEAGLSIDPVMLYHTFDSYDPDQVNDYRVRFGQHVDLVISTQDSIMIKNPWLQDGIGFYGIVTDSLDRVLFAGSMLDPEFLICSSRQFGSRPAGDM